MNTSRTQTKHLLHSCFRLDKKPKRLVLNAADAARIVEASSKTLEAYPCSAHGGFHFARTRRQ